MSEFGRIAARHPRRPARSGLPLGGGRVGGLCARAGTAMGTCLLALAALTLGMAALTSLVATVWLMTDSVEDNLTQSMSVFTWASPGSWAVLGAGVAGAVVVVAALAYVRSHARALDAPRATWALVGVTLVAQLLMVWALAPRVTLWGDSWMIDGFVDTAVEGGVASLFRGPWHTIYYDARLYFSCYPFQAAFFWLQLGLRRAFGTHAFSALMALNALSNELVVVSVLAIGRSLDGRAGSRRVLWLLVAAFSPLYWLAAFLYNNALGMGPAFVFLAMQARALRAEGAARKAGIVAASALPLAIALCLKSTFVLFAIASALAWLVACLRRRSAWPLAALACAAFFAQACSALPMSALEQASGGYEFGDGMTTLNHLELGLRVGRGEFYVSVDGEEPTFAPGGWSDWATRVWAASGEDAGLQNQMAAGALASDLVRFASDPSYTAWFFSRKLASEWADPTYQSLYYLSQSRDAQGLRANPADLSTAFGLACTVATFVLDGYQSVTLIAALGCVIALVRTGSGRGRAPVADAAEAVGASPVAAHAPDADASLLLALTFFTGFGCYLLWEAKSVYLVPFALAILPLAASGMESALGRAPRRMATRSRDRA